MSENSCILSVCVRTYNQERFVSEALDSVLMQKTSFPFEIIVSDDCSKDGTRDVLREYQTKYPDRSRLLLGDGNVGGPKNLKRVIEASNAKYVTCLDGDDYYTDCYKLQKQIEFLEEHPGYSACFHNTVNVNADGTPYSLFNPLDFHLVHDAKEFIMEKWFVPIHSAVLRREFIEFPEWYEGVMNDDYVVHLSVVKNAPYYYMPDVMVAYRHHSNNTSAAYSDLILTASKLREILVNFSMIYPEEYRPCFEKKIAEYDAEIAFLESEKKYPMRKYFRLKTYKKMLKKNLLKW